MLSQEDLFAKALMVEEPWFVDKVRKTEVANNPILKNSKYIFLKNRGNLSEWQNQRLEEIQLSGLNLKTMKALMIREAFQQIYEAPTAEIFDKLLRKWYFWATHCRIQLIKEAAYTIQRHWHGVVNWIFYKSVTEYWKDLIPFSKLLKLKQEGIKELIQSKQYFICLLANSTLVK